MKQPETPTPAETPAPAPAERVTPAPGLAPMAWMVGEWHGTGWMQRGPGPRETFHIREQVRWAGGGALLVVDGLGRDESGQRIVHQAFAVVSVDPATGAPSLRAYRAGSGEVVSAVTVGEGSASWGFSPSPGGTVRFTFQQTPAGEWRETGEFSRDGTTYVPFLDMTLTRRK